MNSAAVLCAGPASSEKWSCQRAARFGVDLIMSSADRLPPFLASVVYDGDPRRDCMDQNRAAALIEAVV